MEKMKQLHVLPTGEGTWAVQRTGTSRAARIFEEQKDAYRHANEWAKRDHTEVYVHARDGSIVARRSYSPNPLPSVG
jgi:hypothetical protein